MNLVDFVLEPAEESPDRVCLRLVGDAAEADSVRQLTYRELDQASLRLASALVRLGVQEGDRVVVQADKSLSAVALYLAVLRIGAVFVPLNVAYTANEVSFFVEDSKPKLLVGSGSTRGTIEKVASATEVDFALLTGVASEGGCPSPLASPGSRLAPFDASGEDLSPVDGDRTLVRRSEVDLAAILYTSGTTGRSKGAMLTHGNLVSNARALRQIWMFEETDVLLHVLPIFHVHGLFVALNVALASGATTLFAEKFSAQATVERLSEATVFMGVPTHYSRLLSEPGLHFDACSKMRLFTSGSAPLDPATFEAFEQRSGHRILERYGMTEAGMITSNPYFRDVDASGQDKRRATAPPSSAEPFAVGERVPGTVGFPLPEVEVAICDDSGTVMDSGEVGILRVRGPNVFSGYWGLPEKTSESLVEGGWLISGDQASQDDHGRITLVGRATDMIIVGGYNVYPREIEDCLSAVPGVAEVAVIGVPHPDMGEGVVACLVAAPETQPLSDADLKEVTGDVLADFKRPRVFHWLESLPRNAMGKVQKAVLRERFVNDFRR